MDTFFSIVNEKDNIFESIEKKNEQWGTYDYLNVPTWKHLDEHGNTLVRGHSPRTNSTFMQVILGDCREVVDCLEITKEMLEKMD